MECRQGGKDWSASEVGSALRRAQYRGNNPLEPLWGWSGVGHAAEGTAWPPWYRTARLLGVDPARRSKICSPASGNGNLGARHGRATRFRPRPRPVLRGPVDRSRRGFRLNQEDPFIRARRGGGATPDQAMQAPCTRLVTQDRCETAKQAIQPTAAP